MLIKNRDIIMVGLQYWDNDLGSNSKDIALEFAKHNRVLFVDYPRDRISWFRKLNQFRSTPGAREKKRYSGRLSAVSENLWELDPACIMESCNWVPSIRLFRWINRKNSERFASEILKAVNQLHFENFILFNDNDLFRSFHLKELLSPELSVYYLRDNLLGVPYWYKHGHILQPEICAQSDLVIANSIYLTKTALAYNRYSFYIEQGCTLVSPEAGQDKEIPEDIRHIPSPIIGFIGVMTVLRLDLSLLERLATKKKEWNFLLIGPEGERFKQSILHRMDNVFFLGPKNAGDLPRYLKAFDVAINPQLINKITRGNYPRKIDEYLSLGKPVVATETETMDTFRDYIYLAKTKNDYIPLIEKALTEKNPEKVKSRIKFAQSHSWENSVKEMYKAIAAVKPELVSASPGLVQV